ncbi:hypothetical protein [Clostridium sp.]|uniref:hypothetical protein n=1 Tax=Clostridium sp. TaxID=1506 RepID=UPI003FD6C7E1
MSGIAVILKLIVLLLYLGSVTCKVYKPGSENDALVIETEFNDHVTGVVFVTPFWLTFS